MRIAAVLVALCAPASADDQIRRDTIEVGQTIEREVGIAIGYQCDHDIVEATMKTKNRTTNVFVVTGKREGKTLCRAGTDPLQPSYVFEFTVKPKTKKR
jgi:hypothetical protein